MPVLSFMSANYVARTLGYHMTQGWMEGDASTNAYFRPLATFETRFEAIVRDIHAMGFRAMDIWTAHLNPAWATPEHIAQARRVLARYEMAVVSLAGGFGETVAEVTASCQLAKAMGTDVLGGGTSLLFSDRSRRVATLKTHGVRLGVENHPEKTPEELLQKIGESDPEVIGVAVDTGWFGTHGYDAAQAIERLGNRVFHVHLKDIYPPQFDSPPGVTLKGNGHETCAFGEGVVPLEACVRALEKIGYTGALSIEHEPEDFDPTDDIRTSLTRLQQGLGA